MSQDPPAFQLFNEIGIIDQLASAMFERALPAGMSQAQFTVLNHFVRLGHDRRSPAQLASAFQVSRPTMTSTLGRMARNGLIRIEPDPADGRGKLVSLTPRGRAMREEGLAAVGPLLPLLDSVLTNEEVAALLPVLRKLRIALDAMRDPQPGDAQPPAT